jgi:hypothetical protein
LSKAESRATVRFGEVRPLIWWMLLKSIFEIIGPKITPRDVANLPHRTINRTTAN